MKIFFIYLFLFMSCFPHLKILPLDTDAQPNAFICCCFLALFAFRNCKNKAIITLCMMSFYIVLFLFLHALLIGQISFTQIRELFVYLSFSIALPVFYWALKALNGFPEKLLNFVIYVWGIVGFCQILSPGSFSFLTSRSSAMVGGRGVCSLACEPTFYGSFCIIFMIISFLNYRQTANFKRFCLNTILLLIQIIFFARSSMSFVFIIASCVLALLFFTVQKGQILRCGIFLFFLGLSYFLLFFYFSNQGAFAWRPIEHFRRLILSPTDLLMQDASINERFFHVYIPLYISISHCFIPQGIALDYQSFFYEFLTSDSTVAVYYIPQATIRFMSCFGSIIFQAGIIGVVFLYLILKIIGKICSTFCGLFYFLLYVFILFSAISFNTVLLCLPIAYVVFLDEKLRIFDVSMPMFEHRNNNVDLL